jgi:hypothetical protein
MVNPRLHALLCALGGPDHVALIHRLRSLFHACSCSSINQLPNHSLNRRSAASRCPRLAQALGAYLLAGTFKLAL